MKRLAGILTVELPAVAVSEPEPPQVVARLGVLAITMPVGKLSAKVEVRVASVLLILLRVIVRVELSPALMMGWLKLLLIAGAQNGGEMVVLFNVTAPVSAKNLPLTVEPPSSVIEA